jgi:ABC-type ATPase involved in cell division
MCRPASYSAGVAIALELRGIRKRFTVGAGGCRAFVDVLRGVDLIVRSGECSMVVGPAGAGKTTLLLCAAGLITPESGEREWFGDPARAAALRRVLYHHAPTDLVRLGALDGPHIHLVDGVPGAGAAMHGWIEQRCDTGDAVLVACRDLSLAPHFSVRVLELRAGLLHTASRAHARVAERARR